MLKHHKILICLVLFGVLTAVIVSQAVQTLPDADLSTSTMKYFIDGEIDDFTPGQIIYYVITVKNTGSAWARNAEVVTHIPSEVQGFKVLYIPDGACDNSRVSSSGEYGTGILRIGCLDIEPGHSTIILFKVVTDIPLDETLLLCAQAEILTGKASFVTDDPATLDSFDPTCINPGIIEPTDLGACCVGSICYLSSRYVCMRHRGVWHGPGTTCEPNPCVSTDPVGACCVAGIRCAEMTEMECARYGGVWLGEGTNCLGDPCGIYTPTPVPEPPGACCVGGDCQYIIEELCICRGGTWMGPYTSCVPDPCVIRTPTPPPPPLTGACCIEHYLGIHCLEITESECMRYGGKWQGTGTNCFPNPCNIEPTATPPPSLTGACCIEFFPRKHCVEITEWECMLYGGSWQGAGTSCSPDPCNITPTATPPPTLTGACCIEGYYRRFCLEITEWECAFYGGIWQGEGTSCFPDPCEITPTATPPPSLTGACCIEVWDGIYCLELTEIDCALYGGLWKGAGTSCFPDPCNIMPTATPPSSLTGACCIDRCGTCVELTEIQCAMQGGSWQGAGTTCDPNPCEVSTMPTPLPDTPGACCIGWDCFEISESECFIRSGIWMGACTRCTSDLCPEP